MNKTLKQIANYVVIPLALVVGTSSCNNDSIYNNGVDDMHSNSLSSGILTHMRLEDTNNDSIPDALGPASISGYFAVDTTVHKHNDLKSNYIGKNTLLLGSEDFKVFQKTNEYVNKSLDIVDN